MRLPLEGYCRPGRFFPVAIDGTDASASITLTADGCLPTRIEPGESSRIVPMLAYGEPHELRWPGGSLPLRTVDRKERLIGTTSPDLPGELFPNAQLIPIHLDPADPLPGPAVVWETLNAIVLDSASFARIDDAHRSTFLAGGVTLASRGGRPDNRWPWKQQGSCWILRANLAGPVDDLINEAVYAPTYAWQPGWSPRVRGQVFGAGATILVVVLAILLIGRGSRAAGATAMSVCLIAGVLVIAWRHAMGSIDSAGGDIIVASDHLLQRDSWVYQRAKADDTTAVPWAGSTRPMFSSLAGSENSRMFVVAGADSRLRFEYRSTAGHCLAFMRRDVTPDEPPAASLAFRSPMEEAVKDAYLSPSLKALGQTPGLRNRWPGVIIGAMNEHAR